MRENAIMEKLRLKTAEHSRAVMMSAPDEVNFFSLFVKMICAKKCIEVGVFTGV